MKAFTAICSLILSSFVLAPPMLAQTPAGIRLESGIAKEDVDGDLKSAIDIYQKIAADASAPRDVRSKALLRLAGCYEKLGRQATQVYEQVVHDFADQPAATQARNRLAALRLGASSAPATMTQRKIEVPGASGLVFTDGQRALYRDAATGALVISDLSGKDKRVVFKPKPGDDFARFWPSRDLSLTVINFSRRQDPGHPIALIKTDGTGYREIALTGGPSSRPSWSWDNRYVLLDSASPDGTHRILRVAAADGSAQEVLRTNTTMGAVSFSPDGRFIAYSEYAPGGTFVIPSQGGERQLISGNAVLMDWTRDGRYLAVTSAHSGVTALQLLPVKDGKPAGDPVFVRYGSFFGGQTTASGSLFYLSAPDAATLSREWIADLDHEGRPGDWKHLTDPGSSGQLVPVPTWSPDSGQIVWTVQRQDTGQVGFVARVRDLATGKERDLYRSTGQLTCVWVPRHPNLFCAEVAGDGTATNIFSVAVDSGRTEQLGAVRGRGILIAEAPPNDEALYFIRQSGGELTRWDIGTGQETLLEHTATTMDLQVVPSPDGGWLKRFNQGNIEIRPMAGGDWKPRLPLRSGGQSGWSPDGKWIFYHDKDAAGKDGLYRIATSGGAPERLGDFPASNASGILRISPDGSKIIALSSADNISPETWLLENFEPKQQAAK
jgi:WD40 repeat protein